MLIIREHRADGVTTTTTSSNNDNYNNSVDVVFAYRTHLETTEVSADQTIRASSTWICLFESLSTESYGPDQPAHLRTVSWARHSPQNESLRNRYSCKCKNL